LRIQYFPSQIFWLFPKKNREFQPFLKSDIINVETAKVAGYFRFNNRRISMWETLMLFFLPVISGGYFRLRNVPLSFRQLYKRGFADAATFTRVKAPLYRHRHLSYPGLKNRAPVEDAGFVLMILWRRQSGNHPENNLAKFGYILDLKVD